MSPLLTARYICTLFIVLGVAAAAVQAADSYCFRFTWLGPSYDNDTISDVGNKTCQELKKVPPCIEPLVVTFDGSEPDTDAIWEMYNKDAIACKLTRNTVCLKWVTYYNGFVENITYTCGKMNGPSGAVTDKCESMKSGAYNTIACSCRTPVVNGDPRVPCNSSSRITINFWTSLFIMTSALLALRGANLDCGMRQLVQYLTTR